MPSTSKPPSYPLWTTGDASQVAAPTPAQAASGYTAGQRPAFQLLNWQFWQTGLWLSYLDSAVNGSSLTTSLDPLLRLLGGGQWSWNATTGVLAWSAPFVLQVPGLPDSANQMAAGSVMLSDGQVAYFTANVPFDATATTAAGSSELTQLSYELGVQVGQAVSGSGIAAGTTVVGVSDGVVTMSQAATASASGVAITFVGTGSITAQSAPASTLSPSPNTVLFARAVAPRVVVGVNAGQFVLRDGESRLLDEGGFTTVAAVTAGVSLSARQAVYLSPGNADGGRTQGAAYPADVSSANGAVRGGAVGLVAAAAAIGGAVNVVTSGVMSGFSSLTAGSVYWCDPTTPGNIVATKPVTIGQTAMPVGTAVNATTLALNAAGAAAAQQVVSVNPWPQYGVAQQSDLVTAAGLCAAAGGGVIVLTASFSLSANITLSGGTLLLGRKGGSVVTCASGGQITLADTAEMRDVTATSSASSGTLVAISGTACVVRGCRFIMPAGSSGTALAITGSSNRLYNNTFFGVLGGAATGIAYLSGSNNSDDSSIFLN